MASDRQIMTRLRILISLLLFWSAASAITSCSAAENILMGLIPTATTPPPEPEENQTLAVVTFIVQVPENTPADQPVLLSILDEVTGLALNAQRYPMEKESDGEYRLELPFTVGSVVKYRYSRSATILAEEHTSDGRAVRYRLYHVTAPGEVRDTVSRWNDTAFEGKTGRITGTALDADTGEPVPGLLVTAGGAQAFSGGDGNFLMEGLPPGTHNLVLLALDGSYPPFQQGALVAAESNTPAKVEITRADMVDVTFLLHVPEGTPPVVPVRMAGNIWQLGNMFADLSGGINTLATRMPVLSPVQDRTYGLILKLPAGTDLKYKYTLGDGFWNTERAQDGGWVVRQLIVPAEPVTVEDTVQTWQVGDKAPITFDIIVPENTPPDEAIFIQFNPYGWMEPLPMWHLEGNRWAYILYSPLDMLDRLGYRYCRAGQCGHADDVRTPGVYTSGQVVETAEDPQGLPDVIDTWAWWGYGSESGIDLSQVVVEEAHAAGFVTGVEFQERFHPSWIPRLPETMANVASLETNWLVLTPAWTFTRSSPPVLEAVSGQNPLWLDIEAMIRAGREADLNVVLRPTAGFPTQVGEWWRAAERNFPWWVSWFDRYEAFILYHADLAEANGVTDLILGGEWMAPALPNGLLADGSPSGVPPDAEFRYRQLIAEVRQRYSGRIGWALSYPEEILNPPPLLADVDFLYILWDEALSEEANPDINDMQAAAEGMITTDLYLLWLDLQSEGQEKDMILSLAYPSIQGGAGSCLADPLLDCILPLALNYPAPDFPLLELDLALQAKAYYATLAVVSQQSWINGVVSRGYYPPALLQDKSTSIHGKPVEEVLRTWYLKLLENSE